MIFVYSKFNSGHGRRRRPGGAVRPMFGSSTDRRVVDGFRMVSLRRPVSQVLHGSEQECTGLVNFTVIPLILITVINSSSTVPPAMKI